MAKATTQVAVPKKDNSKESLAASVPISGDHGREDLESYPKSKPAVLTRDDQLRFKATNKEDRKQKAKARKGKKGKNGKKKNKGKGNKALTGTKAPISRKRRMMKKQTSQDEKTLDVAEPEMTEKPQKKPRKVPTGSSTDVPKSRSKRKAEAVEPVNVDEKPPRKRKTCTAEPEGKVSEAKPKAKAKAKAKAASKTGAAPKKGAAPKAKASAVKPKAKAKGRPKKDRKDDFMKRGYESEKFNPGQVKMCEKFAKSFDPEMEVKSNAFKQEARGRLPSFSTYRLNIYWTRASVGVTHVKNNKDVVNFSFNTSSACSVHKIAVALRCAIHAVA